MVVAEACGILGCFPWEKGENLEW